MKIILPDQSGSYVLVLDLDSARWITIGKLGRFNFPAGLYLYSGSSSGPGGIVSRVNRHLKKDKIRRWHVDDLRAECTVAALFILPHAVDRSIRASDRMPFECEWSQALADLPGARILVSGFGSSDCRSGCKAHLVQIPADSLPAVRRLLWEITPGISEVVI